ncbi:MAG: CRISPR-associated CARF protein Csa3 [Archaeoglobaceae archaeon]
MKTTLIATLGFDEKFCYRAILRHGIKEGDEVILITAEIVEKVEKAYEWIKRLIQASYSDKVAIQLIQVDVKSPVEAIKKVAELLKGAEGKVIVNLSGGMRALVAIVLLACLAKPKANIEIETEDLSSLLEIPSSLLSLIKNEPSENYMEILMAIKEGLKTVHEIAKSLGKDESTIRRQLQELERMELIVAEKRKPLIVKLTNFAELFL